MNLFKFSRKSFIKKFSQMQPNIAQPFPRSFQADFLFSLPQEKQQKPLENPQIKPTTLEEHLSCRNNSALFDISSLFQVKVFGEDKLAYLEKMCVSDLKEMKPGVGALTVFLNENGGIIDDSIVINHEKHISLAFNGYRKEADLKHMENVFQEEFQGKDVRLEIVNDKSMLSFQGPKSAQILQMISSKNLNDLGFMEFQNVEIPKLREVIGVTRCGFTGEDGFELSVSKKNAAKLIDLLSESGKNKFMRAGTEAKLNLRLEAGLCVYGRELTEDISPVEASLKWLIGKRRRAEQGFIGSNKIMAQLNEKIDKIRVGFRYSALAPIKDGFNVFNKEGLKIGEVTSCGFSPILQMNIGMAYIDPDYSKIGSELMIKNKENFHPIAISKMPFIPSKYYKK